MNFAHHFPCGRVKHIDHITSSVFQIGTVNEMAGLWGGGMGHGVSPDLVVFKRASRNVIYKTELTIIKPPSTTN